MARTELLDDGRVAHVAQQLEAACAGRRRCPARGERLAVAVVAELLVAVVAELLDVGRVAAPMRGSR